MRTPENLPSDLVCQERFEPRNGIPSAADRCSYRKNFRVLATVLILYAITAVTSHAHAKHSPWFDPCSRFFFQNLNKIDISQRVEEFVNKQMNEKGYGNTENEFTPITRTERLVFERTFNAVRNGELENPAGLDKWLNGDCQKLRDLDYVVRPFLDESNRRITVIYEIPVWYWESPGKSTTPTYQRGWGLFLIGPKLGPGGSSSVAVEVPHACRNGPSDSDDFCDKGDSSTHVVGAEVFELTGARYLFVNGTPRTAVDFDETDKCDDGDCPADVAHPAGLTMFQVAHRLALKEVDKIYQPHGFGRTIRCADRNCDAVVSSGNEDDPLSEDVQRIGAALEERQWSVCVFSKSSDCVLNATTNVQQQETTKNGKSFVSVEVRTPINQNKDPKNTRAALVDAISQALP